LSISDKNDDKKKEALLGVDDKEDQEIQLKQIRQDMELLREDKSRLEVSFSAFTITASEPCGLRW